MWRGRREGPTRLLVGPSRPSGSSGCHPGPGSGWVHSSAGTARLSVTLARGVAGCILRQAQRLSPWPGEWLGAFFGRRSATGGSSRGLPWLCKFSRWVHTAGGVQRQFGGQKLQHAGANPGPAGGAVQEGLHAHADRHVQHGGK
eukprot:2828598-Pyramimonas_sp.AAC.1